MTVAPYRPFEVVALASPNAAPSARDEQRESMLAGSEIRKRATSESNASLDIVEMWGVHSFPASDPPANW
jgi:hypothetical protein